MTWHDMLWDDMACHNMTRADRWQTDGRPMADPWQTHGRPMADRWQTYGRLMADLWQTYELLRCDGQKDGKTDRN